MIYHTNCLINIKINIQTLNDTIVICVIIIQRLQMGMNKRKEDFISLLQFGDVRTIARNRSTVWKLVYVLSNNS